MPRFLSPFDEARWQGRLWTPRLLGSAVLIWNEAQAPNVTLASGAASAWNSLSNTGRNWSQSTAGLRPTWSASGFSPTVPGLVFDGADDLLQMATTSIPQPFVVVMACRVSANVDSRHLLDGTLGTGNRVLLGQSSGAWVIFAGANVVSGPAYDTNPHVFTVTYNGASSIFAIDGATVATGNPGTSAWVSQNLFCEEQLTRPATGACFGLAVCTDIAPQTVDRLTGYFAWQASLQNRLAAAHPFRARPPLI